MLCTKSISSDALKAASKVFVAQEAPENTTPHAICFEMKERKHFSIDDMEQKLSSTKQNTNVYEGN